jgi:hypothetical protein
MDADVLNNGVSYFTGPLLNWTLVGVLKALLREIHQKGSVFYLALLLTEILTALQSLRGYPSRGFANSSAVTIVSPTRFGTL